MRNISNQAVLGIVMGLSVLSAGCDDASDSDDNDTGTDYWSDNTVTGQEGEDPAHTDDTDVAGDTSEPDTGESDPLDTSGGIDIIDDVECLNENCQEEWEACQENEACMALIECAAACPADTRDECVTQCSLENLAGAWDILALQVCAADACDIQIG